MSKHNIESERDEFLRGLIKENYSTYYISNHPKYSYAKEAFRFTSQPVSLAVPQMWGYTGARKKLFELSQYLDPEEADRRNLNFVNPALADSLVGATLPTLRGGIQLLFPGENAPTHRHSANAFRFILEAPPEGASTVIEGTRIPMYPGDLILTPNWVWHDHHNLGDSHSIWYDGLDALITFWTGGMFFQWYKDVHGHDYQEIVREATSALQCIGSSLLPESDYAGAMRPTANNQLYYYPYKNARSALFELYNDVSRKNNTEFVLQYMNPVRGGAVFPTMDAKIHLIKERSSVGPIQRTENVIYIIIENSITFELEDGTVYNAEPFDIVAIPSWTKYNMTNNNKNPSILLTNSDRPIFESFHFYRDSGFNIKE